MWVARNQDGSLHIWILSGKPKRYINYTGPSIWKFSIDTGHKLPDELFPELKWEDEPIEVEIIKK